MKHLLLGLLLGFPAYAENPLSVALVSEAKAIAPGQTFTVGLHLKPPPGYHTYWKHPGIVGLATTVEWSLPPGFKAGEIQWPAPEAVKMARYTAQGYRGETLLMVPVTTPASLAGSPVTLSARVSWMCCGEQCHPGSKVPFSITLPVAEKGESDPMMMPLFEKFRAKVPQADPAWTTTVERGEKSLVLTLRAVDPEAARGGADLGSPRFLTADGQVDSNGAQKVTAAPGGGVRIELPVSDLVPRGKSLPGVVVAGKSWSKGGGSLALEIP